MVVETALTPQHGAQSGNVFQCEGEDIMHAGPFARMLCYCARQLAELPSPADTPVWEVRCPSVSTSPYHASHPWHCLGCTEIGVSDVPMLHTLTSRARPGWNLMTN